MSVLQESERMTVTPKKGILHISSCLHHLLKKFELTEFFHPLTKLAWQSSFWYFYSSSINVEHSSPGLGNDCSIAVSLCYLLTFLNYPTTNNWHLFCGWHLLGSVFFIMNIIYQWSAIDYCHLGPQREWRWGRYICDSPRLGAQKPSQSWVNEVARNKMNSTNPNYINF